MKKLIYTITIILFCGALAIANNKTNKLENQIKSMNSKEVVQAAAVEEVKKDFKIINTYVNKSNNNIIEFNDNSYVIINHNNNIYEFYAAECGDYEIKAINHIELINIIKTYMINKYNMDDLEVENHNIFKNNNLICPPEAEKEIIKPIAATQENKKVVNVVKKETNNNTIKNEVIEEPATEEAEESQEQPQNSYTEEDYNKYLEYKESLIQEHGEEIYKLMNQEAGIKTEEESFSHFMEYGI